MAAGEDGCLLKVDSCKWEFKNSFLLKVATIFILCINTVVMKGLLWEWEIWPCERGGPS